MMAAMLKTALAAICLLTLSATLYLSASLLILQPPRANYQQWALIGQRHRRAGRAHARRDARGQPQAISDTRPRRR